MLKLYANDTRNESVNIDKNMQVKDIEKDKHQHMQHDIQYHDMYADEDMLMTGGT